LHAKIRIADILQPQIDQPLCLIYPYPVWFEKRTKDALCHFQSTVAWAL